VNRLIATEISLLLYLACLRNVVLAVLVVGKLAAYSVQTHEQLIDLSWKATIRPFILRRFPHATDAELERAHSFAYGGCAIQDLGYYPGGNRFFSDLSHYVRSGDFVAYLFEQAKNPDELAFAIGALSHYVGDNIGHSTAINPSVGVEFPKLAKRYGSSVTYDQNPHAHVRTEFAFDINEISKRRMAPSAYLRHIGLRVPSALLAQAFSDTYGLDFNQILGERRPVVRGYRFAVRSFLPRIAYAETVLHRRGFPPDVRSPAFQVFERNLAEADFKKNWDQYRKKAGIGTHLLAWTIFVLPKFGPLSMLAIRGPNPDTHERYVESVNNATDLLRRLLANGDRTLSLPNRDLDTGEKVRPGAYPLTDQTYAKLLRALTTQGGQKVPTALKQDVLEYYADPQTPISTKSNPAKWAEVQRQLIMLKAMPATPEHLRSPSSD
jgi:Zinc dependent phospholipase C